MNFSADADLYYLSPTKARYLELLIETKPALVRATSWSTEVTDFELDQFVSRRITVASDDEIRGNESVGWIGRSLVYYSAKYASSIDVEVAGETEAEVMATIATLREAFPIPVIVGKQQAGFTFWHYNLPTPGSKYRSLDVPRWDEVIDNYATASTQQGLASLMAATEPEGGKLLLWSGPPGTGKTYAIRALAWEWRNWIDCHYLIDPDMFFGASPGALMNMMTENENGKWKLFILEDTGEMLTADAKSRVGQGLSRLLNIVDGLLGQSLKVLILITTNEELGTLHPAVTRPGRCWQHTEFEPLRVSQSYDWLRAHGVNTDVLPDGALGSSMYLADLYSQINDWGRRVEKPKTLGFDLPRRLSSPVSKESV